MGILLQDRQNENRLFTNITQFFVLSRFADSKDFPQRAAGLFAESKISKDFGLVNVPRIFHNTPCSK
jgi:hypothetical protein